MVEQEMLKTIQSSYEHMPAPMMCQQFCRQFAFKHDDSIRRSQLLGERTAKIINEQEKVERLHAAIQRCATVVAIDENGGSCVGRQLLEVQERLAELALLKLHDLHMKADSIQQLTRETQRWWQDFCEECPTNDQPPSKCIFAITSTSIFSRLFVFAFIDAGLCEPRLSLLAWFLHAQSIA